MNATSSLAGSHLRTYETIFQHPLSHNLNWRAVHALLKHLGQVEDETNGKLKLTRNGQTLVLHRPNTKDVASAEEIMTLRHFLKQSETIPSGMDGQAAHWLLVIDHQHARIFRSEMHGAIPRRITPHEPEAHFRPAHDARDFSRGKDKPDPGSFFKPVADVLQGAGQILIFGTGTGASSEMEQFIAWFKLHHPDQAKRIVGSLIVDEHHLTEDELLAKARDFYTQAAKLENDGGDKREQKIK